MHSASVRISTVKDDSALWAFRYTENLAQIRFGPMRVDTKATRAKWEALALSPHAPHDRLALAAPGPVDLAAYTKHADAMLDAWWSLGDALMLKHTQPAAPRVGMGVSYPGCSRCRRLPQRAAAIGLSRQIEQRQ